MPVNKVFYDARTGIVLAVHDATQVIGAKAYEADGRIVKSVLAMDSEIPGPLEMEVGEDGRLFGVNPRVLSEDWLSNHIEPSLSQ